MYLTKQEEKILDGEEGRGIQKAMELIVTLGDINQAEKLIDIKSSQVSGVSYKTIGDAGIEFLREWSNNKVKVLTTLNPMGVDLETWKEYGFPKFFVDKQMEILNCFVSMGILPSCTCTPYLIGNLPRFAEHVAWAESSAVVFANSVLGARTNRESGISALACAIVGKTPLYGLHLEKNRKPTLFVEVEADMKYNADYSALGYYMSKNFNGIPLFKFKNPPCIDELKAMSASLGVGSINMFQVEDVTPESNRAKEKLEKVSFGNEELREVYDELTTTEDFDIICVGCPHCSMNELREIYANKLAKSKKLWVYTAKQNKAFFKQVISDTCMVVSPLEEIGIEAIATNSAKAAFYSKNLSKLEVKFAPLKRLLKLKRSRG